METGSISCLTSSLRIQTQGKKEKTFLFDKFDSSATSSSRAIALTGYGTDGDIVKRLEKQTQMFHPFS
jgi:hypothetical protein